MSAPSIPDDAQEDIPPSGAPGASGKLQEVNDPDGKHRRKMDLSKLNFGFILIATNLVGIITLSVLQYYVPGIAGESLNGAIDTLKLITTTALGFVFGRALGRGEG